jgi:hypothetical protein
VSPHIDATADSVRPDVWTVPEGTPMPGTLMASGNGVADNLEVDGGQVLVQLVPPFPTRGGPAKPTLLFDGSGPDAMDLGARGFVMGFHNGRIFAEFGSGFGGPWHLTWFEPGTGSGRTITDRLWGGATTNQSTVAWVDIDTRRVDGGGEQVERLRAAGTNSSLTGSDISILYDAPYEPEWIYPEPLPLAADAQWVYRATGTDAEKFPLDGGAPVPAFTTQEPIGIMFSTKDGMCVAQGYAEQGFNRGPSRSVACVNADGEVELLHDAGRFGLAAPMAVGEYMYWIEDGGPSPDLPAGSRLGRIGRKALLGGEVERFDTQASVVDLATDGDDLYWLEVEATSDPAVQSFRVYRAEPLPSP